MIDNELKYNSEVDMEELLAKMHYELIMEEVNDQIDTPFNGSKRNFLELYHDKYKFYKNEFVDNDEFQEELASKHNETFDMVLERLEDKYSLNIDRENVKINKLVRILYNFFIIDYEENLTKLIVNFITKNKKAIITELKNVKNKTRDVSYITSKLIFNNQNEGLLVNNLNNIIFGVMPNYYDSDDSIEFLKLIVSDDYVSKSIMAYFDEGFITCNANLFDIFMEPLWNKEDGFSVIISNCVIELYSKFKTSEINILETH